MARSSDPHKGPTHHTHWSIYQIAVSSFSESKFFPLLPVKSCLVMAKAKHLVGFIDAPVYPGTNPAVAKLTNPSEHPTAKGPPSGPSNSRCRGSRATPKARTLLSESIQHNVLSLCRDTYSKAKDETVSIKSACPTVTVPGFRKQPPPRNL